MEKNKKLLTAGASVLTAAACVGSMALGIGTTMAGWRDKYTDTTEFATHAPELSMKANNTVFDSKDQIDGPGGKYDQTGLNTDIPGNVEVQNTGTDHAQIKVNLQTPNFSNVRVSDNNGALGYFLVKVDKSKVDDVWLKHGSFAIVPGTCGAKPTDPKLWVKPDANGFVGQKLDDKGNALPISVNVDYGENTKIGNTHTEDYCVWGQLDDQGRMIYETNEGGTEIIGKVEEGSSDKTGTYYENTINSDGVGEISQKQTHDDDKWHASIIRYRGFQPGDLTAVFRPVSVSGFCEIEK